MLRNSSLIYQGGKKKKTAATTSIKADIEKKKLEAMEARKVEEVCTFVRIVLFAAWVLN